MSIKLFITLIAILLFNTNNKMADEKAVLIYVGDPMCSWCYGISEEFSKTADAFSDELKVEMLMGGLRPHNTQSMNDLKDFLKEHWQHVNEASGQPFKYDVLERTDWLYDTEPACRAVVLARQLSPGSEVDFFKAVQRAFYFENKNPGDLQTYLEIAEKLEIDVEEFEHLINTEELQQATRDDFARSGELGVRGFPTIILQTKEKSHLIANGFSTAEEMTRKIKNVLTDE